MSIGIERKITRHRDYINFRLFHIPLGKLITKVNKRGERQGRKAVKIFYKRILPKNLLKAAADGHLLYELKETTTFLHPITGEFMWYTVRQNELNDFLHKNKLSIDCETQGSYYIKLY